MWSIFEEIMAEHVPDLMKSVNLYIWEAQHTQRRANTKRFMSRHTIMKLLKNRKRLKQQDGSDYWCTSDP